VSGRLLAVLGVAGLVGCADLGRRAVVSVDEYDDFRRFRLASTTEAKLGAAYEYLRAYPVGAYRSEVHGWFTGADGPYVDGAWQSIVALEAFLRAVPEGPEAARASARLVELRLASHHESERERLFEEKVRTIEGRLAEADEGRRSLVRDVVTWVRRLAAIRSWGGRTSELDHEFIYAFRLTPPEARCTERGCTKTVSVSYAVPEGKAQSPRQAVYDVVLGLDRGGIASASITGPELFTRLGEAARVSAVHPDDWVGRAEAIGQATLMLALAIEPVLPASRCWVSAVSPVVLERACDGVVLRVVSAVELGEEDRVEVSPDAARSGPQGEGGGQEPGRER